MMSLNETAAALASALKQKNVRVVLAESCTAGLAAATLAQTPGVSEHFCGSAVVYRQATKQAWLRVSESDLGAYSAVSEQVARQMAAGVLRNTPEADFAASITGHLGPDAPPEADGVVFIGVVGRDGPRLGIVDVTRHQLGSASRQERQGEAAGLLLLCLQRKLR
jgi:nicotinamide-nucleotide amidase